MLKVAMTKSSYIEMFAARSTSVDPLTHARLDSQPGTEVLAQYRDFEQQRTTGPREGDSHESPSVVNTHTTHH